jgi:hypothetical protein
MRPLRVTEREKNQPRIRSDSHRSAQNGAIPRLTHAFGSIRNADALASVDDDFLAGDVVGGMRGEE